MKEQAHFISIVICAYTEQRWHALTTAVASVQRQTKPPGEIIVVIDHNTALLQRAREHFQGVFVIENKLAKGLSGARNSGLTVARGEVVAFLDDDAVAQKDWLENLVAAYTHTNVLGVGGRIDPLWLKPRPDWFPDEFNWVVGGSYTGLPSKNAPVRNLIGANMSLRRDVLTALGGFREAFGCNKETDTQLLHSKWLHHSAGDEETEFCIRATQRWPAGLWLYAPAARVEHCVSPQRVRWAYFLWRCYDEGLGKALLVQIHGTQNGLSAERKYVAQTLTRGVLRGLADTLFRSDASGLARSSTIILGFITTVIGYLVGTVFLRPVELTHQITCD